MGNFGGIDRRVCFSPNTLKKEAIAYLSKVYRQLFHFPECSPHYRYSYNERNDVTYSLADFQTQ